MTERHGRVAIVSVIALSVVAHVWKLGLRPLAHDEAIDAWFSWQARSLGVMRYDPVYHGPLRFYLEGPVLAIFGTTPGWARAVAAAAGVGSTAIIATSRKVLGPIGAPVAALLFTVSPTVLTVTRTGREDSLVGLVSLAMLLVVARGLPALANRHLVALGVLLALAFTIKETTFIFVFAAAWFFLGLGVVARRRPDGDARAFFRRILDLGTYPWLWTGTAFVVVLLFVFTSGFRYNAGFESGLLDGIRYWWGQHDVGRGSQRWSFYLSILWAYEWLLLVLVGAGLTVTWQRRSIVGAWFATMGFVQLLVYTWAGEKFAWLALHPTIPLILLAGLGVQGIADHPMPLAARRFLASSLAIAAAVTAVVAVRPAITDGADPRELLVTVQTSTDLVDVNERLAAADRAGTVTTLLVDDRDSGAWPWVWYLHDRAGVEFRTIDPDLPLPAGYDAYIVSAATDAPELPPGYTIERFRLREWWLPDYDDVGIGDLATWFFTRRTWNATGSSDQYLVIRSDAAT